MPAATLDGINRPAIEFCLKELVTAYDTAMLLRIMARVCEENAERARQGWVENGTAAKWEEKAWQIARLAGALEADAQPTLVIRTAETLTRPNQADDRRTT